MIPLPQTCLHRRLQLGASFCVYASCAFCVSCAVTSLQEQEIIPLKTGACRDFANVRGWCWSGKFSGWGVHQHYEVLGFDLH